MPFYKIKKCVLEKYTLHNSFFERQKSFLKFSINQRPYNDDQFANKWGNIKQAKNPPKNYYYIIKIIIIIMILTLP